MDWILRLSLRSAYGVHNFLENAKFQECVWSAWILVCKWSPGSAFGVRTFQQKKMWECVGVRRSALKDSQVRLECALLTHCYALQTHFSTARVTSLPAKQPWWIWINTSCEFIMNDCITTTKQSTTKPCAYFLGYTVVSLTAATITFSRERYHVQISISWLTHWGLMMPCGNIDLG